MSQSSCKACGKPARHACRDCGAGICGPDSRAMGPVEAMVMVCAACFAAYQVNGRRDAQRMWYEPEPEEDEERVHYRPWMREQGRAA